MLAASIRLAGILFVVAAVCRLHALADDVPTGQGAPYRIEIGRTAADDAVDKALDQPISLDGQELTIQKLVTLLGQQKIDVLVDHRALDEAAMDNDASLRPLKVSNISIRSLLGLLLDSAQLGSTVRDGKLLISTTDVLSNELYTTVYQVEDLVRQSDGADYDSLIDLITTTVRPDSWGEVGGPASIPAFQGTLAISQTRNVHQQISKLLAALRESRDKQRAGAAPEPLWVESPADQAARRKFAEKSVTMADFRFQEQPLANVVQTIAERFGVQIVLDTAALEEAGIETTVPVTAELHQVSLPVVLSLVLAPLETTYVIKYEVVQVTTTDVASTELTNVVYPVADLVQEGPIAVGANKQDFNTLIDLLTATVKPQTWDSVGGPASVSELGIASSLVINQTQLAQTEIASTLAALRRLRTPPTQAAAK